MPTALVLVDHGSRLAEANESLSTLAALVRARIGEPAIVEPAHMELAAPSIADAIRACVAAGADQVVVVPCFLAAGRHATQDVPRLAREAADQHPGLSLRIAEPLGAHALIAELALLRANDALGR